jgi:hypothetical protein
MRNEQTPQARNVLDQVWDSRGNGRASADPAVSGLDELDAEMSILLVSVAVLWHRWSIEVVERHEEPHRRAVIGDQVL